MPKISRFEIGREHPEWINAFNSRNEFSYWYESHDMDVIGSFLIKNLIRSGGVGGERPLMYVAPFGREYGLGFEAQIRSNSTQIEQLKRLMPDVHAGKRLVGNFCISTNGVWGNHWIAYHLHKNLVTGELKCFYKDSLDREREDFQLVIKSAFTSVIEEVVASNRIDGEERLECGVEVVVSSISEISIIRLDKGKKEQKDGSNCGLFALKNMEIFASLTLEKLESMSDIIEEVKESVGGDGSELISFYSGDIDCLLELRHEFGNIYVRQVIEQKLEGILLGKLGDKYEEEATRLKENLCGAKTFLSPEIASTIKTVKIIGDPESHIGYSYQIKCIGLSFVASGRENLINQLELRIVDSREYIKEDYDTRSDELMIRFNPEHIKPKAKSIILDTRLLSKTNTTGSFVNWRNDPDLVLNLAQKKEFLKTLILELRPFCREDLQMLEEICIATNKIGEEIRFSLIQSDCLNKTLLHTAAEAGDTELLQAMLMAGESANIQYKDGAKHKSLIKIVCSKLLMESAASEIQIEEKLEEVVRILINDGAQTSALGKLRDNQKIIELTKKAAVSESKQYTDAKVGEVRVDLEKLKTDFEHLIETIPTGTKDQWVREKLREDRLERLAKKLVASSSENKDVDGIVNTHISESQLREYEGILGSFCKYLQNQIRITLEGTIAAASGVVGSSHSSSIINVALGAVPYVGFILKAQAEVMQGKQSSIWLKEKVVHFPSSTQQDSVIADYASFVLSYNVDKIIRDFIDSVRKHESSDVLKESTLSVVTKGLKQAGVAGIKEGVIDFSTDVAEEFGTKFIAKPSFDEAKSAVVSSIKTISKDAIKSGIKTSVAAVVDRFSGFFFDKRDDSASIPEGWKSLVGGYVLSFMDYLLNHRVNPERSDKLGEDIAREVLPSWAFVEDDKKIAQMPEAAGTYDRISGIEKLDNIDEGFSLKNATIMSELCSLVYRGKEEIGRVLGREYGCKDYKIIEGDSGSGKDLRAIAIKEDKDVIIVFGSTGSNTLKILDPRSESIDVFISVNITAGADISGSTKNLVTKKINVHKEFWKATCDLLGKDDEVIRSVISNVVPQDIATSSGGTTFSELGNIYITGHAVGGAIAMATYIKVVNTLREMIVEGKLGASIDSQLQSKVAIYTYGQPKFLKPNKHNKDVWEELGAKYYRILNDDDIVPQIPISRGGDTKFIHSGTAYYIGGAKRRGEYEEDVIKRVGGKITIYDETGSTITGNGHQVIEVFKRIFTNIGKLMSNPSAISWLTSVTTDPFLQAHDIGNYHKRLDEFRSIDERTKSSVLVKASGSKKAFMQSETKTIDDSVVVANAEDDATEDYESIQHMALPVKKKHVPFYIPPRLHQENKPKDIWEAITKGNVQAVKEFLDNGWRPKDSSDIGQLISTAKNYFQYEVLLTLAKDDRVWVHEGYGLHRAVIRGEVEKCKEIIPAVIENIRKSDDIAIILQELASIGGYYKIIDLLEREYSYFYTVPDHYGGTGPDIFANPSHDARAEMKYISDIYGRTALHYAAYVGHVDTIKFLCQKKIYPLVKDKEGNTALHYAVRAGHFDAVLQLAPITSQLKIKDQSTVILEAIKSGKVEIVHYLLEQNFKTKTDISYTKQMTLYAMESFNKDMLVFLALNHKSGLNSLYRAVINGEIETLKKTIEGHHSADTGKVLLMLSAFYGELAIVDFLINYTFYQHSYMPASEEGDDPDPIPYNIVKVSDIDYFGRTALHYAAYGSHNDTVKFLVDIGANPTARDKNGDTALSLAIKQGKNGVDVVKFLIVEERIKADSEMFMAIIENKDFELFEILIRKGKIKPTAKMLLSAHQNAGIEFITRIAKDIEELDRELIEEYKLLVSESGVIASQDKQVILALEDALYIKKAVKILERYEMAKIFLDSGVSSLELEEFGEVDERKCILKLDILEIKKLLASTSIAAEPSILDDIQPGYKLLDSDNLIPSVGFGSSIGELLPASMRVFSAKQAIKTIDHRNPVFSNIEKLLEKIRTVILAINVEIKDTFLNETFRENILLAEAKAKASKDYIAKSKLFDGYEYQHLFVDVTDIGIREVLSDAKVSVGDVCHMLAVALQSREDDVLKVQGQRIESLINAVWILNTLVKYYDTYRQKFIETYGDRYKAKDKFKLKGSNSDVKYDEKYIRKVATILEKGGPIVGIDIEEVLASSTMDDKKSKGENIAELSREGKLIEVDFFDEENVVVKRSYLKTDSVLSISTPKNGEKTFGRHPTAVDKDKKIFYKYWPYAPGIEFVVNSFNKVLLEDISLPTSLVKLVGRSVDNYSQVAIYQASPYIEGENFHYFLERPEYVDLIDSKNFTALFLSSLLTGAGDAKPDNFIVRFRGDNPTVVSKIELLGIDNDISFCSGRLGFKVVAGKGKVYSDLANVLFFLPQMDKPLYGSIALELMSNPIKPIEIVSDWLSELCKQNLIYKRMLESGYFTQVEADLLKLPIKLPKDSVQKLYLRLLHIVKLIEENEAITPNEIFRSLYPGIAYYYELKRNVSGGDPTLSIKQIYADAADDEKLAAELISTTSLARSREIIGNISNIKAKTHEQFIGLYNTEPYELAVEFLKEIDFSDQKFVGYEKLLCKIIGDKFKFLEEIQLKNIRCQQLELLVQELIIKPGADGSHDITRKPEVLINKIIILSGISIEEANKVIMEIRGSHTSTILERLGIEISPGIIETKDARESSDHETELDVEDEDNQDTVEVEPQEKSSLITTMSEIESDFVKLLDLACSNLVSRESFIEFSKLIKKVRSEIKVITPENAFLLRTKLNTKIQLSNIVEEAKTDEEDCVDNSVLNIFGSSHKAMFIETLQERKQLSSIMVELINNGVIEKDDIGASEGSTLLHTLIMHPRWFQYSELIETIARKFPEHLGISYKDKRLPADVLKQKVISEENGYELLAMLLNHGAKLTNPTTEEELMIKGVEFSLSLTSNLDKTKYKVISSLDVSFQEIRDGIYDHSKIYKVLDQSTGIETKKSILHFAIEEGDVELFKLALESYEEYESYEIAERVIRDDTEFISLPKLLLELFKLAIDIYQCKTRYAEIIEIIYDKIEDSTKPSLYENGEMKLIPQGEDGGKEALFRHISKLYKMLGWPITIGEAIEGIDINRTNSNRNTLLAQLIITDEELFEEAGLSRIHELKFLLHPNTILKTRLRIEATNRLDGKTPLDLAIEREGARWEISRILEEVTRIQQLSQVDQERYEYTDLVHEEKIDVLGVDIDIVGGEYVRASIDVF